MSDARSAARRSCSYGRAKVSTVIPDTEIIREKAQSEWDRGCRWAGFALALTFGPMMALGVMMGW